jgi:hypothetical protein
MGIENNIWTYFIMRVQIVDQFLHGFGSQKGIAYEGVCHSPYHIHVGGVPIQLVKGE